jgi:hypothetical protein
MAVSDFEARYSDLLKSTRPREAPPTTIASTPQALCRRYSANVGRTIGSPGGKGGQLAVLRRHRAQGGTVGNFRVLLTPTGSNSNATQAILAHYLILVISVTALTLVVVIQIMVMTKRILRAIELASKK